MQYHNNWNGKKEELKEDTCSKGIIEIEIGTVKCLQKILIEQTEKLLSCIIANPVENDEDI